MGKVRVTEQVAEQPRRKGRERVHAQMENR